MVGRSKPQKKMDLTKEEGVDFAAAEIAYLKAQNKDLAKALAESKLNVKQIVDERDYFQRQSLTLHMRNSELLGYIKNIDDSARKSINAIVVSSNYITEIAHMASLASIRKTEAASTSIHNSFANPQNPSSPSTGKMHAVRPMVDGHVIYRPIINLRRVNEIPHEELLTLRSSPQALNEIGNNLTPNQDDSPNVSSFRVSGSASTSMPYEHSNHTPANGLDDEEDDEYLQSSSNIPETENTNRRNLHTIEELSENLMDSSSRSDESRSNIASPGTNSVNIPSCNSQVPLLSGVFRDVRVYLSPMQNMSQYLESLQGISTESRKPPNAQKKHYSPRTSSLDENNQCVFNLKPSSSCLDGNSSNLPSVNNSFEDANNSILTSTRIGSNCDETFRERNSEFVNKCRWSNHFENTTIQKKVHWNNSSGSRCNTSSTYSQVKNGCLNGESYSSASFRTPSTVSTAYDPLEGPSSLLDSTILTRDKLETLSMLGLKPKLSLESLPNSPSSPAASVLKRRERNQQDNNLSRKKSIFITKRKLDTKRSIISSKVVKRSSNSPLKISQIKKSVNSPNTPDITPKKNILVKRAIKQGSGDLVKKKIKIKAELKQELTTPESSNISTPPSSASISSVNSNKPKRKRRKLIIRENEVPKKKKKSLSPQKTPKKKRQVVIKGKSLKEPSLNKKMRRS